ncbi:MAG TPA: XTP/dITP diphosphatase, partial [Syntrophomonadaceae bacterium]|nr:XTP/dITP diphosphatase [Syntrophomonadaceae bacterium]
IVTLDDIEPLPEVEEDGVTFEANAIKKASINASLSGLVTLADDSGLVVDALDGKPGVYSARFAGEHANDEKNNQKLLALLNNIPEEQRTARFKCVIAICAPGGKTATVEGSCEGKIAIKPSGQQGFGYDPLFIPEGWEKSFAMLSGEEKNRISHRGKALQKALPIIADFFPCAE